MPEKQRLFYGTFEEVLRPHCGIPKNRINDMAEILIPAAFPRKADVPDWRVNISKYRHGELNFPVELLLPYRQSDAKGHIQKHFNEKLPSLFNQGSDAKIKADLRKLVDADDSIDDDTRSSFFASGKRLIQILADVFLYAMLRDCVLPKKEAIHNITVRQNPFFKGRENELETIRKNFRTGKSAGVTQCLTGMGGVGKTQLALEYAFKHLEDYDTIWWLDASDPDLLYRAASDFIERKELRSCKSINAVGRTFAEWFEDKENGTWLLVYDNFEDLDSVLPYMPVPKKHKGDILFTTRLRCLPPELGKTPTIPVDVLWKVDAVAFLKKRTALDDETAAAILAERLGYLPLALEQAGAYIAKVGGVDFTDYLSLLEEKRLSIFNDKYAKPISYNPKRNAHFKNSPPWSVTATFHVSLGKIEEPGAEQLLRTCAYFAPDSIPLSLFEKYAGNLQQDPLKNDVQITRRRNRLVQELEEYSLIKRENGGLSMHRLLQEVVVCTLEKDKKGWLPMNDCFTLAVSAIESEDIFHTRFDHVFPHVYAISQHVANALKRHPLRDEGLCEGVISLLCQIATCLESRFDYLRAKDCLEQARNIYVDFGINNSEALYNVCCSIAQLCRLTPMDSEIHKEAYKWYLLAEEAVSGQSIPQAMDVYYRLACVSLEKEDLDAANDWLEKAHAVKNALNRAGESDPIDVEVGFAEFYYKHNKQKFNEIFESAQNRARDIVPESQEDSILHYTYLALINRIAGQFREAIGYWEKTLPCYIRATGKNHPNIPMVHREIAREYRWLGESQTAMEYYEQALLAYGKFLGLGHFEAENTRAEIEVYQRELDETQNA